MTHQGIEPGIVLGNRFVIGRKIGQGGFGAVYIAADRKLNERIAVKILWPMFVEEPRILERFKREIKLTRSISHENVLRVYDLGEDGPFKYVTMEYVPGRDLREALEDFRRAGVESVVPVMQQICRGLSAAHRLGIIHRDLKPENIRISEQSITKILDFGLARAASDPKLTATGLLVGTPHYMSPEQFAGEKVDLRSDIYALGVILYELFAGVPPFEGNTPAVIGIKHLQDKPRPPSDITDVPKGMEEIILRALEKNPDDRFQSADELLEKISKEFKVFETVVFTARKTGEEEPVSKLAGTVDVRVEPISVSADENGRTEAVIDRPAQGPHGCGFPARGS